MAIQTGAKGATIAGVSYPPYFYIDFLTPDIEALAVQGGDAVMVPARGLSAVAAAALVANGAGLTQLSAATDILRSGIPFIKAPSSSTAANAAITFGTPLGAAYPDGCYMYFPGGVLFGGSVAGWYYTVANTVSAAKVFNNVYVTGNPRIPAVPTPIVAAGPGAWVGANSVLLAQNTTLLGNSMGPNGSLVISGLLRGNASVGGKTYWPSLGGTLVGGSYFENDARPISHFQNIRNRGRANRQVFHDAFSGDFAGYLGGSPGYVSIDTGLTQVVGVSIACGSTDWMAIEALTISNFPMA